MARRHAWKSMGRICRNISMHQRPGQEPNFTVTPGVIWLQKCLSIRHSFEQPWHCEAPSVWVQGGQPERLYLWRTFVNTLRLSQWNKWHTYMLRGASPKGRAPGEGEIRGEVISTFIFFTISFFRHIWSQCKLEIRRDLQKMEFIWSGSIALQ